MSLQEIFHKAQGWLAELWNYPIPWGTLFFWAALIISVMAAINALAVSAAVSGDGKDNSDAPGGPKGEKRPADVIGAAVMVDRIATGEIDEGSPPDDGKLRHYPKERPQRAAAR
jgi:hypothetical protein